ncbi:hypothetical protein E8E13_010617 [Curvularia kusanoi]|uniref:RNA ligase domain-containing protein n=1 Tax=Curvularia kusanoi TaxID=90978 RepID=A0A9P4WCK5_CURKU|nr:hypothetical protein E8E13_010617 [Curvularia kusanoi]
MSTSHAPALYPKITQHVSDVVKNLRRLESESGYVQGEATWEPIPIVGFAKLHGTHADILVYADDGIVLQSKNVSGLTASNDNHGFAVAMAERTVPILELRDQYITRWRTLNPDTPLQTEFPVLIAGEWIGTNIQKDVAISQLSPRFVIVSVNINNSWVPDTQYLDIEAPSVSIYNISRGGTFSAILDPTNIACTVAEVESRAEEVASSCPFAASLGIDGEGEGIVWKLVPASLNLNPALWFKTKGGRFRSTFAPAPKAVPVDLQEKRDAADAVAKIWCTQERLWQGWEFLREIGTGRDMKGLGKYLQWVQNDVLTEERGYIEDHGVDKGMLRIGIVKIAKVWYIERLGEE